MCSPTHHTVHGEADRPTYLPPAVAREPFWPYFVAVNEHPGPGHDFYVRRPRPLGKPEVYDTIGWAEVFENVQAFDNCPLQVGAFIAAAERWADRSPELRQYRQLIRALELASEVALDMAAGHSRLCGCPLCVLLAALDDREPGFRRTVWAGIEELPALLAPVAKLLGYWVVGRDVSTAKAIRRSGEGFGYCGLAEVLAQPSPSLSSPKRIALAAK